MADRGMEEHVERAAAHVAKAIATISKQRAIVAKLEIQGHDTAAARELLAELLKAFEPHEEDWHRIRKELNKLQ
jgi:hypothetical protein